MTFILLSTYNGEKYLDEQLHSLVKQEGVEFNILVRDDGSTDSTHDILNRWQDYGLLTWYTGSNIGYARSFLDLLVNAPQSEYYAFCDQDDIWLPNKLEQAIIKLDKLQSNVKLYCSNLEIFRNGVIEKKMHPENPIITLPSALVSYISTGCTQVFNHNLRLIVESFEVKELKVHDLWLFHTAMLFGEVSYDENSYILYRQHSNNMIGSKKGFIEKWRRRLNSIKMINTQHDRENQAKELLRCYNNILTIDQKETLSIIANFRKNIISRLKLVLSKRYIAQTPSATFWVKLRILIGSL